MKQIIKMFLLFGLITSLVLVGCTASKKGCGCPSKKGLIGY